jgi:hypothetical protein
LNEHLTSPSRRCAKPESRLMTRATFLEQI